MADEDIILFMKGDDKKNIANNTFDVWDDTALIKAYDKAVKIAKEEVTKRLDIGDSSFQGNTNKLQTQKHSHHGHKPYKKWTVGSACRAIYSEDGETYEAVISKLYDHSETCLVKFIGYGNTEEVKLSTLQESEGLASQVAQQKKVLADQGDKNEATSSEANFPSHLRRANGVSNENMDCDFGEPRSFKNFYATGPPLSSIQSMMPPAPPLPPQLMARLPEDDADALSSMLMSWYISGFHTGYYHGLKQAKDNQERRKK